MLEQAGWSHWILYGFGSFSENSIIVQNFSQGDILLNQIGAGLSESCVIDISYEIGH